MKYDLGKWTCIEHLAAFITRRLLLTAALVAIFFLLVQSLHVIYGGGMSGATQTRGQSTCSDGWYITGYYVPREDELPETAEQIDVEREREMKKLLLLHNSTSSHYLSGL